MRWTRSLLVLGRVLLICSALIACLAAFSVLGTGVSRVQSGAPPTPWANAAPSPPPTAAGTALLVEDANCSRAANGAFRFLGAIRNATRSRVRYVRIRLTVFDADGRIVGTRAVYADSDEIMPGAASTFSGYVDDPSSRGALCLATVEDWSK